MFGTKRKPTVTVLDREYVTTGQRLGNLTIKKNYQVEYPQDLN